MKNTKGNVVAISIIIVIVIIAWGVIGWLFAKEAQSPKLQSLATQSITPVAQKQPTAQPATQPVTQTTTESEQIKSVVKKFYDTYFEIVHKADAQYAQTGEGSQFGDQIKQQEVENVTSNFFMNTDNKMPLACTTDWATYSVKNYSQPIVSNNSATETVEFSYNSESKIYAKATLSLVKTSDTWKIDNLSCSNSK